MGAQGLNVAAWSPADVANWLGGFGFDEMKAAALRNGGKSLSDIYPYYLIY